jgi:RimJ/RimL family protein N-acetyltransferase
MQIPTLTTPRLRLRAFRADDLDPYAGYCADERFMQYLMAGRPISREEAWANMASILGHWALRGYGVFALERRDDGAMIGFSGLLNPLGWPGLEVCWGLGPVHWGQGFATEAVEAVIDWAFARDEVDELISLIHPDNTRSMALAERVGETLRDEIAFKGKRLRVYHMRRSHRKTRPTPETPSQQRNPR